jgi:hypothetical protein
MEDALVGIYNNARNTPNHWAKLNSRCTDSISATEPWMVDWFIRANVEKCRGAPNLFLDAILVTNLILNLPEYIQTAWLCGLIYYWVTAYNAYDTIETHYRRQHLPACTAGGSESFLLELATSVASVHTSAQINASVTGPADPEALRGSRNMELMRYANLLYQEMGEEPEISQFLNRAAVRIRENHPEDNIVDWNIEQWARGPSGEGIFSDWQEGQGGGGKRISSRRSNNYYKNKYKKYKNKVINYK